MDRQPRKRCQTCLKHESGEEARKLHRGKPADSEVQSQVSKDGRIQQKYRARQHAKRKEKTDIRIQQKDELAQFKSVGMATRVHCMTEASRIRRTIAAERSANDIAKQMTMTRKREKAIRTCEEK